MLLLRYMRRFVANVSVRVATAPPNAPTGFVMGVRALCTALVVGVVGVRIIMAGGAESNFFGSRFLRSGAGVTPLNDHSALSDGVKVGGRP